MNNAVDYTSEIPASCLEDYRAAWFAKGLSEDSIHRVDVVEDWINNREIAYNECTLPLYCFLMWEADKIGGSCELR
jgi:hypothetical protein